MENRAFSIESFEREVRASSTFRLAFEPKGEQLQYRSQMRDALRTLRPSPYGVLEAEYATPDAAFADLENVLLYNLGSGCYSHLTTNNGLVCRRVRSEDDRHRVRYTVTDSPDCSSFEGDVVAHARLESDVPPYDPTSWWAALRPNRQVHSLEQFIGEFAITVEVGTQWNVRSAVSCLKPLLDGFVSSLHSHDGSDEHHVRRALLPVGPPGELWESLNSPDGSPLGQRRLVRPHKERIAWNPADERCSAFRVMATDHDDALTVVLTATA